MSQILHTKDVGSITVYGDAVNGGYGGTKAQIYSIINGVVDGAMLLDVGSRDIVLSAANWDNGEYDLTSLFPSNRYMILTIGIDGDTASGTEINEWYAAEAYVGDGNILHANGTEPTDDIHVAVTYQSIIAEVAIPAQSGSLTYTGQSQSPTWINYDQSAMTISGDVSGTNAGTYTAVFTLNQGYKWSDGTRTAKNVLWSIGKANGYINLSKSYFSIAEGSSDTITILDVSGNVSVESDDTSIATVALNNNSIVATYVSTGETSISVSVSATNNYSAYSGSIGVYSNYQPVYGVSWAQASTQIMTRTDRSVGITQPVASVNGNAGSSPFDNIMPWAGMQIVDDPVAGKLVSIPKFYYKWSKSGNTLKLQISPIAVSGYFVSPAHADRGDGVGERNVVYVGRYPCNESYKSGLGTPAKGSRDTQRTNIHALGNDIWHYDMAFLWTLRMLYLVEYATWDFNSVVGNSSTHTVGDTDSIPYHTGTNKASYTMGGAVQYRNIELAQMQEWIDGVCRIGTTVYCVKNPEYFADDLNDAMVSVGTINGSGYAMSYNIQSTSGFEYMLLPSGFASSGYTKFYNGLTSSTAFSTSQNSFTQLFTGLATGSYSSRLMKL